MGVFVWVGGWVSGWVGDEGEAMWQGAHERR